MSNYSFKIGGIDFNFKPSPETEETLKQEAREKIWNELFEGELELGELVDALEKTHPLNFLMAVKDTISEIEKTADDLSLDAETIRKLAAIEEIVRS